ncbi:hypothetical protein KSP40_PGU008699 [Platanthera guangdongensis]|uniref:Uncharacterized protein n=1 Tax=Platanthera guangdongensis TaxID=2320717 RepID=A0ABR2M7Q2_9ASPA
MAGGNFIGRIVSYVVNELVVEGLANNQSFQRFAVRTSKTLQDLSIKAERTKQEVAEQIREASKNFDVSYLRRTTNNQLFTIAPINMMFYLPFSIVFVVIFSHSGDNNVMEGPSTAADLRMKQSGELLVCVMLPHAFFAISPSFCIQFSYAEGLDCLMNSIIPRHYY